MTGVFLISHGFQGEYEVGFANGLARNGITTTLVGADRTPASRLEHCVQFLNLRGDQSEKRSRWTKISNMMKYWIAYGRLGVRNRDGVFHFIGMFSLRSGMAVLLEALYARAVFKTWVLTVHNLLPHDSESKLNVWVHSIAYRLPDLLIVHTREVGDALRVQYGVKPGKIVLVEHGIDRFVMPSVHNREFIGGKFGIPPGNRIVLLFGNVWRYKGIDLLIEALEFMQMPADVSLLIVGKPSGDAYRSEIEALMRRSKYSEQIFWSNGYLPDGEVPALLSAADALVLPYRKIDQSGVMFAAKSAGLPVLATDVGAFSRYVEPGTDILVPANDVRALAQGLVKLIAAARSTDRMKAIEIARRYDWKFTLGDYANMLIERKLEPSRQRC